MIHERGKECFDTGTNWDKRNNGGNAICFWYIEAFTIIRVEALTSGDQSGQGLGS